MTKVGPLVADKAQQSYVDGVQAAAEAVLGDLSDRTDAALRTVSPQIQELLDRAREGGTYFGNRGEHRAD